jgi:hypothetical protein
MCGLRQSPAVVLFVQLAAFRRSTNAGITIKLHAANETRLIKISHDKRKQCGKFVATARSLFHGSYKLFKRKRYDRAIELTRKR